MAGSSSEERESHKGVSYKEVSALRGGACLEMRAPLLP